LPLSPLANPTRGTLSPPATLTSLPSLWINPCQTLLVLIIFPDHRPLQLPFLASDVCRLSSKRRGTLSASAFWYALNLSATFRAHFTRLSTCSYQTMSYSGCYDVDVLFCSLDANQSHPQLGSCSSLTKACFRLMSIHFYAAVSVTEQIRCTVIKQAHILLARCAHLAAVAVHVSRSDFIMSHPCPSSPTNSSVGTH
jgi:hypothetical protein